MTVALLRDDLHADIESHVRRTFDERAARATTYGEQFAALWRSAADQVRGGKMLRPRLLVDMHEALRISDGCTPFSPHSPTSAAVVEISAAVEILHYAFLLHDDVIDGDARRRGRPNLIGALRETCPSGEDSTALHWGTTSAILMGDLLLSLVHQMFAKADLRHDKRLRLLDLLDHAVTETVAGEYADVALSDGVITPELQTILTMTARKTATYTFELPLRIAAVIAGCTSETEDALAAIGQQIGLAFQLQDDSLSVFGDPTEHGKDPYSDIREGKETALIAYARLTGEWGNIEPHFGDPHLSDDAGDDVCESLRRCGAEAFVQQLIDEQIAAAQSAIVSAALLPDAARTTLTALVHLVEGRRA